MSTSYYVENTEYDEIPAAESVLADADALIAAGVATATAAAAASATSAASSATSAAASLTSFNGVYYGALAADPTLDPNGNAPNAGDFYYNTTGTALKVYSGSAWQSYSPVAGAPSDADYLVKTANGSLSAERVVTDTASVVWDWATAGQSKANVQFGTIAGVAAQGNDSRITGAAQKASNLSDLASAATARTNLGLVASATTDTTNAANISSGTLPAGRLPKAGQKGIIYLVQDATGSRTITSWGSQYKFPNGVKPTLSTGANSIDVLSYCCKSTTEIECFFSPNMS
jgi:hypothetical protein